MTAPPEPALEQLLAGVRMRAGAVLIGPAGVGKTTLARSAADRLGAEFPRVDRLFATASRQTVPFAAFEPLWDVPETGTSTTVLRAALESLGDGRLLVVDDAHLLDPMSAALICQLALSRSARLLITATLGDAPVPAEIAALWRDGLVARIDLKPPGHDDARLMTQIKEFAEALPAPAHRILELLTVSDPLSRADAEALTDLDAVEAALRSGAVVVEGDELRPAHPLFLDAIRDALGGPDLRRLRTTMVAQISRGSVGVVGRLRLAALALDSDRLLPVPDTCAAASDALRLGDLELSERLGRAALGKTPDLGARLTVGYSLAWQGRGREADAVLAEIDPAALTEDELMAWALPTAANQFWMLSEPERATAFLRATRSKVTSPAARVTLDALSATFTMNAGSLGKATELADAVLASPDADDTAVGWAASAAALSSARMGRFTDVDALAERALAAGQPGLLRFTSGLGQTTALLMTGRPEEALELALRITDFAQRRQPARAIGEVLVADVLIATGELSRAVSLLREAATTLAPTGYSWGPLAWMLLAQALGRLDQTVDAGKALSRAESRHGLKSMLFAPELALARAWTTAARHDTHGAVAAAREAVKAAERGGQRAVALRAALDGARLGDARALDTLSRLAADVDCAFGRAALAEAGSPA
ncbi:ATP-binding protein [Mycolicibacterium vanbaalenii]|uniref:ATP-binding protein n=1 Tax=Mycolicibacterium vanbaalenii TaxID=110539 RepID=UPI001F29DAC9|nr:ATP-binding protein [Mycolicibacterium vanbaalenii]UJL28642.1 ATP-binding protein [Mycolicibacterium vanbaalenii]WND55345.1 ATP-binding protein [Mycolicibacterium vanbaalenii]